MIYYRDDGSFVELMGEDDSSGSHSRAGPRGSSLLHLSLLLSQPQRLRAAQRSASFPTAPLILLMYKKIYVTGETKRC